jgi:hypothetical protein
VVESLHSTCKVLGSILSMTKKKKFGKTQLALETSCLGIAVSIYDILAMRSGHMGQVTQSSTLWGIATL